MSAFQNNYYFKTLFIFNVVLFAPLTLFFLALDMLAFLEY